MFSWGLVIVVSTLSSLLASFVLLGKRVMARNILLPSTLINALAQLLYAVPYYMNTNPLLMIIIASIMSSIAFNVYSSSISAILTSIIPIEVRGRLVGIQRIFDNIGAAIASLVAGVLYTNLDYGLAFMVTCLIGCINSIYLYLAILK